MKRLISVLVLAFSFGAFAQTPSSDKPATEKTEKAEKKAKKGEKSKKGEKGEKEDEKKSDTAK